jgi:hypothetical protein
MNYQNHYNSLKERSDFINALSRVIAVVAVGIWLFVAVDKGETKFVCSSIILLGLIITTLKFANVFKTAVNELPVKFSSDAIGIINALTNYGHLRNDFGLSAGKYSKEYVGEDYIIVADIVTKKLIVLLKVNASGFGVKQFNTLQSSSTKDFIVNDQSNIKFKIADAMVSDGEFYQ